MVRAAGQKEYARVAEYVDTSREKALMVYLLKHIDGITSFVNGHESQREDVRGRITDAIVYLCLLWGMIDDKDAKSRNEILLDKLKRDKI